MLIWQAINYDYTLVSHDQKLKEYIEEGLKLMY
jgi:PIN domain nuclease of toxin-antitoxin system